MCTLQSMKSNILYLMIITIYHKIYIKVCQVFIFVSVINLTQVWCYYYKPVIILNHACFDKVQNPYKYLYISLYNFINIYFLINANNCVSVNWRTNNDFKYAV